MKKALCILLLFLVFAVPAFAQKSDFMYFSRLGLSVQKKVGVDIGLISFNQWNDNSILKFYDISLGVETFIAKPFILSPKLNLDVGSSLGIGEFISLGGGVDLSLPTDFSKTAWMLTPKIGVNFGSLVRLYYGRHVFQRDAGFPDFGKHRISIEVNTAALSNYRMGI